MTTPLLELPDGEWIAPDLVRAIRIPNDPAGPRVVLTLQKGKPKILPFPSGTDARSWATAFGRDCKRLVSEAADSFAPNAPTITTIMQMTAAICGVSMAELTSERRGRRVVTARHVAMFLCRTMTLQSFPAIALRFGGRDHTTVINAVTRVADRITCDPDLAELVTQVRDALKPLTKRPNMEAA